MKELLSVVSVVCASSLICTIISTFITNSSTKKIINLVLGAFIVCCMIVPVKNACQSFNLNLSQHKSSKQLTSTDDEAYSRAVINQTRTNLEQSLKDLLLQSNIKIKKCKIILSQTDKNSIIISSISIYIDKTYLPYAKTISKITYENFSVSPNITTE